MLGFVGANSSVSSDWVINDNQLIGFIAVSNLLPHFMAIIFTIMLLSGLCSTLDSILCATSSLSSIDLMENSDNLQNGNRKVAVARIGMLATAAIGLGIALIPGL